MNTDKIQDQKSPSISLDAILKDTGWEHFKDKLEQVQFDFIDCFSGCGGMSYGFHRVGEATGKFRLVGAFDIDPHANQTYKKNYHFSPSTLDLGQADVEDVIHAITPFRNPLNPLIVIGCAPCQGFSSHRKKDSRKDIRNSLVGKFARIAVNLAPDMIIMENVPDILSKKHWHHYEVFKQTLEESGYSVKASIVNMAEYGVPQARFRAVVVAARNFVPTLPNPRFSKHTYRTVRDAIGSLPPLEAGQVCSNDPMHVTSKHRQETIEILRQIPRDGGSRPPGVGPACLDKVTGFYDVYGRLAWDKSAITITARCRTPSCGRFAHPEQDRGLSVREAALLQGFPPDFTFEGPFDDKFKQIGNAVPPLFSAHLAAHILSMLAGKNQGDQIETISEPFFQSYSSVIAHVK